MWSCYFFFLHFICFLCCRPHWTRALFCDFTSWMSFERHWECEKTKRDARVGCDGRNSECTHCCTQLGPIGINKYARLGRVGGGWVKWKPPKRMFILCNANGMRTTVVACRIRCVLCGTSEFKLFFIAQRKEITSASLESIFWFGFGMKNSKILRSSDRISEKLGKNKKKKTIRQIALYCRKGTYRSSLYTRIASHLDLPAIQCSRQTYQIPKLSRRSSPNDLCNHFCFFFFDDIFRCCRRWLRHDHENNKKYWRLFWRVSTA